MASVDSPTTENIPQLKRDIGILEEFSEHLFLEVTFTDVRCRIYRCKVVYVQVGN